MAGPTPSSRDHLVVVGASLAGVRAVEAARATGFAGQVTLIGDEIHLPYDRPTLSKDFLQVDAGTDPLGLATAEALQELGVDLALGQLATRLDTQEQVVTTTEGEYPFSAAVIATGSSPVRLPGADGLRGVHVLRTLEDARALRSALDAGARTVVVGAGFIGAEVASAASKRGLPVTIVEAAPVPLVRAVGTEMGATLAGLHETHGTTLRCGIGVERIEGSDHVESVVLADGERLPADLVVVGIGSRPNTSWLTDSGLALDDGVVCDAYLRSSAPTIFSAGDVARWDNALFGRAMRIEHYTAAAEQGMRAARNAVGNEEPQPYETVPYFWSDWYGQRIQFVGITTEEVEVVVDALDDHHLVALYRQGDRIVGALTLNGQRMIMKLRRMISQRLPYADAVEFLAARRQPA